MRRMQELLEQGEFDQDFPEAEPDTDLDEEPGPLGRQRILRQRKKHKYFSLSGSFGYQTSDNALQVPDNQGTERDVTRLSSVGAGYHYNLPRPYTARSQLSYQTAGYAQNETLDYDFFSFNNLLRRRIPIPYTRSSVSFSYGYESLLQGDDAEESTGPDRRLGTIYNQHVFNLGLRSLYPLSRFQYLTGSISVENEATTSVNSADVVGNHEGGQNDPEKTRLTLSTSYRYQYSQQISFSASYQFTRDWYRHQDRYGNSHKRMDYSHFVNGGVTYKLINNLNLGFNLSYNENHSNYDERTFVSPFPSTPGLTIPSSNREYDAFTAMIQLRANTRF